MTAVIKAVELSIIAVDDSFVKIYGDHAQQQRTQTLSQQNPHQFNKAINPSRINSTISNGIIFHFQVNIVIYSM